MKIIHCADLHLDSKMESNLSSEKAKERREEIIHSFERMVEAAEREEVRVIMIAGDLFDGRHVHKKVGNRVLDLVRAYPHMDFLYLRGNHDDSNYMMDLQDEKIPENLKLFQTDKWTTYTYEENGDVVAITGREITPENNRTLATGLVLDQANLNLVMLHGQESEYSGRDKTEIINRTEFKNKHIDYLALGHIHSYMEGSLDDRGIYVYSGCLEGRGFDECGEKGYVLLDISEHKITKRFVPNSYRELHEVSVSLEDAVDMPEVMSRIGEAVQNIPEKDLLKLVLEGRIPMDLDLDLNRIQTTYGERFYFFKIKNLTQIKIDYESYQNDQSLKGEFVRLLKEQEMDEGLRSAIIEMGMKAIMGEEIDE